MISFNNTRRSFIATPGHANIARAGKAQQKEKLTNRTQFACPSTAVLFRK